MLGIDFGQREHEFKQGVYGLLDLYNKYYETAIAAPDSISMQRLPGTHGSINWLNGRMFVDIESLQNKPEHVMNKTLPHEVAHWVNRSLGGEKQHSDDFEARLEEMKGLLKIIQSQEEMMRFAPR